MAGAPLPAPGPRYAGVAQALHWLTFALLLVSIPVAVVLANAPPEGALKFRLYTLHESIGLTVGLLTLARIAWRRRHPPPPPLPSLSPALVRWQKVEFVALYACLLAMPMLGWIANSAFGFPPHFWWLVELPSIAPANKPLGFAVLAAHRWLGFALLALLALHIGGALWHHFVWKDGTLRRMLPGPRGGLGPTRTP